jgi:hypothetical protein
MTLEVTEEEYQMIMAALAELPLKLSANLYSKLQKLKGADE